MLTGGYCQCGWKNEARYLTAEGDVVCGLCAIGRTAVRLSDLPVVIGKVVRLLGRLTWVGPTHELQDELRELITIERGH